MPHVVASGENFWTISRLYYGSGRYFKALWKANAVKFPEIASLQVGNVVNVPPLEDLDQTYFESRRGGESSPVAGQAVASRDNSDGASDAQSGLGDVVAGERRGRARSATGARPPGELAPEVELPVSNGTRGEPADHRNSETNEKYDSDSAEPEIRTVARPRSRAGMPPAAGPPVYKVRPNDTLRSIARDVLSDAHRAGEILELNRPLISDPNHLTVGQVLELPSDARSSVRR